MNDDRAWLAYGRWLAWLVAATFFTATLLIALMALHVTAAEPTFLEGEEVLVDNILIFFASEQARWPQDLLATLLFAVGFAAVAGLGAVLPRIVGGDDARAPILGVSLVVAGALGVVAQLIYAGGKEAGIRSDYCECALRAEQIIGRSEALGLVLNIQGWLTDGFAVAFAVGLLALGRYATGAFDLPAGLLTYSRWLGIIAIAFVVFGRLLGPLLAAMNVEDVDTGLISLALIAILAGVLTPIWAVWLARSLAPEPTETAPG